MLKVKKISYVVNAFPTISETFIVNQIIAAINAGYSVNIFTKKLLEPQISTQEMLLNQYSIMDKCIEISRYSSQSKENLKTILKLITKYKHQALMHFYRALRSCSYGLNGFGLYSFIRTAKFLSNNSDIYHAQFGPNGCLLVEAKKLDLIKGKIITTFHGYDASSRLSSFDELKAYYSDLFKIGELFTVNTPYLADQLLYLGCPKNKLHIIPMGINTTYFKPKSKNNFKDDYIKLLSVGRLVPFKSFDLGIRAVSNLVILGYNLQYTIIGDGDQKEYLKKLVKSLGLYKYVRFTGALNQEKIKNYMQDCDIFLMTSTYDENMRRETQGVVTAEAQACGLPVCAFRSGGVPYTIKDCETGFLSEEKNVEEYTDTIKTLIDNYELRYKMGIAAREFIKRNYSLDVSARKLLDIYNSI